MEGVRMGAGRRRGTEEGRAVGAWGPGREWMRGDKGADAGRRGADGGCADGGGREPEERS